MMTVNCVYLKWLNEEYMISDYITYCDFIVVVKQSVVLIIFLTFVFFKFGASILVAYKLPGILVWLTIWGHFGQEIMVALVFVSESYNERGTTPDINLNMNKL